MTTFVEPLRSYQFVGMMRPHCLYRAVLVLTANLRLVNQSALTLHQGTQYLSIGLKLIAQLCVCGPLSRITRKTKEIQCNISAASLGPS